MSWKELPPEHILIQRAALLPPSCAREAGYDGR
jgi:hypothetical protein